MAKEWRFVLRSELRGEVELVHEPENWRSRETKLVRDMNRYGIALEISSPFVLIKDGFAYVKDVFNRQGYNAQIWIDVFQLDTVSRRYVSYFSGELILKTIEIEDIRCSVMATPSGTEKLLKDREGKDVLIDTTWSFDYNFLPVEVPFVILKTHSRLVRRTFSGQWTESRTYSMSVGELLQLGFDEILVDELPGIVKERATIDSTEVFPILKVEEEGTHTFDVHFIIRVDTAVGDELAFFYRVGRNGTPVAVSTVFTSSGGFNYFTVTCDDSVNLKKGDTLYFYGVAGRAHTARIFVGGVTGRPSGVPADKWILSADTTVGDMFPQGLLAFEACEKALKNMLGNELQLVSTALGRTDLGYAADAPAGMCWIGSGRGLAFKGGQIKTNFRQLFSDGLARLWNLGLGIERATDGSPVAVIEGLDYFFSRRVGITIEGVSQLRKRVATELIYSQVLAGFQKYQSDLPGALEDPHTQVNYLIPGRFVENNLDIRSTLIGSSWKIEEKRRDFIKENTRTESDTDLYVIQVKREGETYSSLTDELFADVEGVENADTLYNLDLVPSRQIRRWGPNIAACYYRQNDLVRYASSESESQLQTQKSADLAPIRERDDINSLELGAPYWLPEVYEFSCKLTAVEDRQLLAKKYDVIRVIDDLGDSYYGYLLERSRTEKNEAQFTLLRANYNG